MSKKTGIAIVIMVLTALIISSAYKKEVVSRKSLVVSRPLANAYSQLYFRSIGNLSDEFKTLEKVIEQSDLSHRDGMHAVSTELHKCRTVLKSSDIWTRYLEANTYRKLNGPLPVEWETEVFEKFEKPYRMEGYGLTILETMIDSNITDKGKLEKEIIPSIAAMAVYNADSVIRNLNTYDHFFLCNRLFLLNLAAIYTTGFECPCNDSIIPELRDMLSATDNIYSAYNQSFTQTPLKEDYRNLFEKMKLFVSEQPSDYQKFDHYTFIRDYVNPLFALNQQYIRDYKVKSQSFNDYTLNDKVNSIFDKDLYEGQNALGIYSGVTDAKELAEIKRVGKMLFFDPILSGNNERSCVSCHKPTECFTDTSVTTALNFDMVSPLPRNTPSLVNVTHNHLLMLDGKLISLQNQARAVITNPREMGGTEEKVLAKVLSCKEYKDAFEEFKKHTYKNKEVTFDHIISAITAYEGNFSNYTAPFDAEMNSGQSSVGSGQSEADGNHQIIKSSNYQIKQGFNLFMGKAQCGTCHYVPIFNGVRPPYVESEFEVLGVPADSSYHAFSADSGRADIYFSSEMLHAFRTGTVRNSSYTKPYMHNGVFTTMQQVIDFYNAGGGAGKGLKVSNQTLSPHPLHLTKEEMGELLTFIHSLDETISAQTPPDHLPVSKDKNLNNRVMGGTY